MVVVLISPWRVQGGRRRDEIQLGTENGHDWLWFEARGYQFLVLEAFEAGERACSIEVKVSSMPLIVRGWRCGGPCLSAGEACLGKVIFISRCSGEWDEGLESQKKDCTREEVPGHDRVIL